MQSAKQFAQSVYDKIKPKEEDFNRIQDLLLFFNKKRSIIVFVGINLIFLALYFLRLSCYSYFFLFLGLYFASPFYVPIILPIFRTFIFGDKVEISPESESQRYTVQEFSAFCGTVKYQANAQLVNARAGIENKSAFLMFGSLFVLNFVFFLFLSIPDALTVFIILNGCLFLPLLLQKSFSQQITNIQERGAQIILDFTNIQDHNIREKGE